MTRKTKAIVIIVSVALVVLPLAIVNNITLIEKMKHSRQEWSFLDPFLDFAVECFEDTLKETGELEAGETIVADRYRIYTDDADGAAYETRVQGAKVTMRVTKTPFFDTPHDRRYTVIFEKNEDGDFVITQYSEAEK